MGQLEDFDADLRRTRNMLKTKDEPTRRVFRDTVRNELEREMEQPKAVPVPQDPWAHRSSGMRCKTCMWFAPKAPTPTSDDPLAQRVIDLGRCRRHAPTMSGYPAVFVNDWCGDHKLNENAL